MRQKPRFVGLVREEGRKRWNQLSEDKELGGAWWLLFRQIQNPRHVLSELLQNADDCGATEASASIEEGCFVFRHNGQDFKEEGFRSLCRFGFSNKRRALTIGFRGIGFKSVFSLGPKVEVLTPTLALFFDRQSFTQPEWIETDERTADTIIRVKLESAEKEAAIRAQIENWINSAVPLLFFRSIRTLRLFDREISVQVTGNGPCAGSHIVRLNESNDAVIVFRSAEEEFPKECLDEVRNERNEDSPTFGVKYRRRDFLAYKWAVFCDGQFSARNRLGPQRSLVRFLTTPSEYKKRENDYPGPRFQIAASTLTVVGSSSQLTRSRT